MMLVTPRVGSAPAFPNELTITVGAGKGDLTNFPLRIAIDTLPPAWIAEHATDSGARLRAYESDGVTQIPIDIATDFVDGAIYVKTDIDDIAGAVVKIKDDGVGGLLGESDANGRIAVWSTFDGAVLAEGEKIQRQATVATGAINETAGTVATSAGEFNLDGTTTLETNLVGGVGGLKQYMSAVITPPVTPAPNLTWFVGQIYNSGNWDTFSSNGTELQHRTAGGDNGGILNGTGGLRSGQKIHLAAFASDTTGEHHLYVDGVSVANDTNLHRWYVSRAANLGGYTPPGFIKGSVDVAMFRWASGTDFSTDWIQSESENFLSPATFYTVT